MKGQHGPLIARIILIAPVVAVVLALAGYGFWYAVQAISTIAPQTIKPKK